MITPRNELPMLTTASANRLISIVCALLLVAACAPTGIYHTVKPGQTLYRIALTYDIDEDRLASINNIKDPTQLKADQRLYIPGATQLRRVPSTSSTVRKPTPSSAPKTYSRPKTTAKKSSPKVTSNRTQAAAKPVKGIFAWPAKGKILNKFGSQGQKVYKGIEISLPKGSPVLAAASGKVIYSGNAIPGYGNLVILEHSNSFFSVYGYNKKCLVKMEDHVGQGDKIALSGTPPNGQSDRLHFEIRKGKNAVNPILFLP